MPSPAERIIEIYEKHALDWDRLGGGRRVEAAWLDRFSDHLPTTPASILDIGCGSGEPVARYLAGLGHRITGVDTSSTLLAMCHRRLPEHEWIADDMRGMSLGRQFDGLIAWNSFFHLTPDDQRLMFPVFRAHAAEHAVLMFTSGPAYGEAIGSFNGDPLYHGSLGAEEYRSILAENGFSVVRHVVEDPDCGRLTVWLARRA